MTTSSAKTGNNKIAASNSNSNNSRNRSNGQSGTGTIATGAARSTAQSITVAGVSITLIR